MSDVEIKYFHKSKMNEEGNNLIGEATKIISYDDIRLTTIGNHTEVFAPFDINTDAHRNDLLNDLFKTWQQECGFGWNAIKDKTPPMDTQLVIRTGDKFGHGAVYETVSFDSDVLDDDSVARHFDNFSFIEWKVL